MDKKDLRDYYDNIGGAYYFQPRDYTGYASKKQYLIYQVLEFIFWLAVLVLIIINW